MAGISVFRWLAWAWMATVLFFDRRDLARPALAYALVLAALGVTVALTLLLRRRPAALGRPAPVLADLACGCALFIGGGLAFRPGAAFATAQSLGVAWPLAGVLSAGAAFGALAGAAAGVAMGVARFLGGLVNGVPVHRLVDGGHLVGTITPVVLFAMAGGSVGYLVDLLRRAESTVAEARARESVARTLHDGVLQTLAVVERRADDPELARMARDQERALRQYLAGPAPGTPAAGGADLAAMLRAAAGRFEHTYGGRVDVVVADDLPHLEPAAVEALAGAVGEALTNAGKHGAAARVTVYVEPEDPRPGGGRARTRVFCSVKDDGSGFDPATVAEGMGLRRSIRGRLAEVGGRVELDGRPGRGTEVRLWL